MASQAYHTWDDIGRPYTLIRPAKAMQASIRAYGIVVYDYPNDAHLKASTPEDHTPFSATGWPGTNRKYNARGLDVMPRSDSVAHRKENADIARQLISDRNAGVAGVMWIKYINWTNEQGVCRQERWMPNHTTHGSSDAGHIHISGRSDVDDDARADGYDPIARMNGEDMADSVVVANTHDRVVALQTGKAYNGQAAPDWEIARLTAIETQSKNNGSGITEIKAAIAALAVGGINQADLVAAMKTALLDPDVQASLVNAINDDAARRLAD